MSDPAFWSAMARDFHEADPFYLVSFSWWDSKYPDSIVWSIQDGPGEANDRLMRAAEVAGRALNPNAREPFFDRWFALLRESYQRLGALYTVTNHPTDGHPIFTIRRVAELSARLCAMQAPIQNAVGKPRLGDPTPASPPFPRRTRWLKDRLRERSWDHNHPQGFGGPDRKTVLRMLDGLPTTPESLRKLVIALNKFKIDKKIELLDIPDD